jgi:hypothetical protein
MLKWVFKVSREVGVVSADGDFVRFAPGKGPWTRAEVRPSFV